MSVPFQLSNQMPLEIDTQSAQASSKNVVTPIRTFTSYNFDKNILTPASAFRFTAPGVDKSLRLAIRSCDLVTIWAVDSTGNKQPIGTGIIDETDTHVTPNSVDYLLTGRDMLGQLVDNAAVDAQNRIVPVDNVGIKTIVSSLIANTRIPPGFFMQQVPNGRFLFQTAPNETKINALQRYLEFTNCLVWTNPQGQVIVGKPDFTQNSSGYLKISSTNPAANNCLEARVRRSTNHAIRQIVVQQQKFDLVNPLPFTLYNNDPDVQAVAASKGGRSVYTTFTYGGDGTDAVNQLKGVGNQGGTPNAMGAQLAARQLAKENVNILDIEIVVQGHMNENDNAYDIDQIYNVQIDDENVSEDMYVYACSYELTIEHGMLTRLKLCRLGTLTAYADSLRRQNPNSTSTVVS